MKFFDLLTNLYGFDPQQAGKIVLVRHLLVDYEKGFVSDIAQNFEKWIGIQQKEKRNQASRLLGCQTVVSFCRPEFYGETIGGHARFVGVFRNHSNNPPQSLDIDKHLLGLPSGLTEKYRTKEQTYNFFDFRRVAGFDDLKNRAVVNWLYGQNWVMRYRPGESKELEVREILPKEHARRFPGVENFTLSFDDLREVIKSREWNDGLSVAGIYAIRYDTGKKNELYIGSAYGKDGIIQRWREYAKDGHGENKELKALPPDAKRHFKFSVLQALSPSMKASQVIRIENRWKEKLGSRHSLNRN